MAKTPYAKLAVLFVAIAVGVMYGIPALAGLAGIEMAAIQLPTVVPVVPVVAGEYVLTTYTFTVLNELNTDAAFGANDVQAKLYKAGEFDWDSAALDAQATYAATTGKISFTGKAAKTGNSYDALFYQNDGGTNLYAVLVEGAEIPDFPDSVETWSEDETVFMLTEGTIKETALDNMEGNGTGIVVTDFDESGDVVTLDKSDNIVQGVVKWDLSIGNTEPGSCVKDAVINLYESDADQFTDIDDIEHIYLSVKSGSGVTVPSSDLVDNFIDGTPIEITTDHCLGSGDSATLTLTIELPAAESDVGTGTLVMSVDDLGDKDARDLDKDKRASAETVSIKIQE